MSCHLLLFTPTNIKGDAIQYFAPREERGKGLPDLDNSLVKYNRFKTRIYIMPLYAFFSVIARGKPNIIKSGSHYALTFDSFRLVREAGERGDEDRSKNLEKDIYLFIYC